MKMITLWAVLMASPWAVAHAALSEPKPECVNVGTPDEGWMFRGEMVSLERCSGKVLVCGGAGEAFEHYWAVNLSKPEQVVHARCSQPEVAADTPVCKAEGWLYRDQVIAADCRGKLLRCEQAGTPGEGWRAYGINQISFLGFARCAQ